MLIRVNILGDRFWTERQPRTKKGQPHQSTTGVLRRNWVHRENSPSNHPGASGQRCAMASRKTGRLRTAPTQKRLVMSRSSELSGAEPAATFFGSRAMPQIGQSPGPSCSTSGCIGQV